MCVIHIEHPPSYTPVKPDPPIPTTGIFSSLFLGTRKNTSSTGKVGHTAHTSRTRPAQNPFPLSHNTCERAARSPAAHRRIRAPLTRYHAACDRILSLRPLVQPGGGSLIILMILSFCSVKASTLARKSSMIFWTSVAFVRSLDSKTIVRGSIARGMEMHRGPLRVLMS